jgi:hypothetical protein
MKIYVKFGLGQLVDLGESLIGAFRALCAFWGLLFTCLTAGGASIHRRKIQRSIPTFIKLM